VEGETTNKKLRELGHEPTTCLLDPIATEEPIVEALSHNSFDCILIGAGLRFQDAATGSRENVRRREIWRSFDLWEVLI